MPNARYLAWTALIALAVVIAHDRYTAGGGKGLGSVRRMGA